MRMQQVDTGHGHGRGIPERSQEAEKGTLRNVRPCLSTSPDLARPLH